MKLGTDRRTDLPSLKGGAGGGSDFETLVKTFLHPQLLTRLLTDLILFTRKDDKLSKVILRPHQICALERLVLDWRKRQQTRAGVQLQIETILDKLPEVYDKNLFNQKCQLIYQHVYDSYFGAGKSIYGAAG